jgi:CRP-like cAMP-binding protein
MAQTALCNRFHSLDQQLCRWLLLSHDRLPGNELAMTQELIANMLGVRREGVTAAALNLQSAGLIRYARGHIHARQGWIGTTLLSKGSTTGYCRWVGLHREMR